MNAMLDQGPPPTDIVSWRRLIDENQLESIRPESMVAAIQDIGPAGDDVVRGKLLIYLQQQIGRRLLGIVGSNKKNRKKIVERAQFALIEAILDPSSDDGQGLRIAFGSRVRFRAFDAIRVEDKLFGREPSYDQNEKLRVEEAPDWPEWSADVQSPFYKRLLEQVVPDLRKRLAFGLHLDGAPYESAKGVSIAKALGINEATARDWVDEVKEEMRKHLEDKK